MVDKSVQQAENALTIRRVVDADIADLSPFLIQCWQETYADQIGADIANETAQKFHSIERLTKTLADPTRVFLVALRNDQIVGTVRAKPSDGGIVFLELLYIKSAHKGLGIGSHLLKRVLKPFGSAAIQLEVAADNFSAIRFYEKHDFMEISKGNDCMGGAVSVPTLLMQRGRHSL